MESDDLPLFGWEPPRQLILFPLTKRVGKIRHTARKLAAKHGDDATLYWKQVASANRKHLERLDLTEEEIADEVRAFFDAVQNEIVRLSLVEQGRGGAA